MNQWNDNRQLIIVVIGRHYPRWVHIENEFKVGEFATRGFKKALSLG